MEVIPVDYRMTIRVVVCCSDVTPTGSFGMGRPRQNTLLSGPVSDSFFQRFARPAFHALPFSISCGALFFRDCRLERKDNESAPISFIFVSSTTMKYPDTKVEEYRKFGP